MSISTVQKNHLNKMNRAAKDVSLGTMLQKMDANSIVTGSTVVISSAQASASLVSVSTGRTGLIGEIVQVRRSGSATISGSSFTNIKVINSGSIIDVTSACVAFAANDVLTWIAW